MTDNFPLFLFQEIRLEINGKVIDSIKNVGVYSSLIDPTSVHKLELIKTIEEEKDIRVLFRGEKLIEYPKIPPGSTCTSIGSYNHHLLQLSLCLLY